MSKGQLKECEAKLRFYRKLFKPFQEHKYTKRYGSQPETVWEERENFYKDMKL